MPRRWTSRAAALAAGLTLLAACAPSGAAPVSPAGGAPASGPSAAAAPSGGSATASPSGAAAAAPTSVARPTPEAVDIAIISGGGYYIPGYLATDRGFLEQEGIHGEWVVAGTPESIRSVVSGSVGIGLLGTDGSIVAVTKGAPLRELGELLTKPTYDVVGTDRYQTIADLRGQDVGVSSVASGTAVLARAFFEANGLHRGDYDLVAAGGNTERLAALTSGAIGAALLSDPGNFITLDQGYRHLGSITSVIPDYDFSGWWANTAWASENPDRTVRFLKAQIRARRWLDDPANREGVLAVLQDRLKVTPTIAAKIYDFYTRETPDALARDLSFNERATSKTIEILGELGELERPFPSATQFYEPSYLSQAQQAVGPSR
jgi:ABC-type nitrate/sulfonate/bicarbonate transport system substrate-binding protein